MGCSCCKGEREDVNLKAAIEGKRKICIWILGGPGSGKGTQCKMLSEHFNLAHLSTGDLLREVVKKDTPLAKEVNSIMERGGLVDASIVLQLLTDAMKEAFPKCNGYLIDGYPREVAQGDMFCEKIGTPHVIVYLECSDDILTERLLKRGVDSGRKDDNAETIKARLETFHGISKPVLHHWKDKVITVDGTLSTSDVQQQCIRAIEKFEKEFNFQND